MPNEVQQLINKRGGLIAIAIELAASMVPLTFSQLRELNKLHREIDDMTIEIQHLTGRFLERRRPKEKGESDG